MTQPDFLTSTLGSGSTADTSMQGYGTPQGGSGDNWASAYSHQGQYQDEANLALQRQGAQIYNPYSKPDRLANQAALSAQMGQSGQLASLWAQQQPQYARMLAQGQAAQLAAARSAPGGSLAQAAALRNAAVGNVGMTQQAAQNWGQQSIANNQSLAGLQLAASQGATTTAGGIQGLNASRYAAQGALDQNQNSLNQSSYDQLYQQGQQVQLGQLSAALGAKGLTLNQSLFNAGQNAATSAGALSALASGVTAGASAFGGDNNNNNNNNNQNPYGPDSYGVGTVTNTPDPTQYDPNLGF